MQTPEAGVGAVLRFNAGKKSTKGLQGGEAGKGQRDIRQTHLSKSRQESKKQAN